MTAQTTVLFVSLEDPFVTHGGSAVRTRMLLLSLADVAAVTLLVADGRAPRRIPEGDPLREKCKRIEFLGFVRRGWRQRLSQVLKLLAPRSDLGLQGFNAAIHRLRPHSGRRFDVGIVSYTFLAHVARLLRPYCKALVLDAHNVEWKTRAQHALREDSAVRGSGWALLAWLLRYFERRELCRYDGIWAVSSAEAEYFDKEYPRLRVDVVPNVVGDIGQHEPREPGARGVLFLGTLATAENTNAALWLIRHVVPRVRRVLPQVTFTIAGRNPPAVLQTDADHGVLVVPNPRDVASLYQSATAVAVPLLEGSGTRVKIIEAFSAGVPVVSTPKGADGLNVVHERHLLLASTPDEFAAALLRVLQEPALRSHLTSEGHAIQQAQYSPAALEKHVRASLDALVPQSVTRE